VLNQSGLVTFGGFRDLAPRERLFGLGESVLFGTALHAAVQQGHLEVVRLLVEQEADVSALDGREQTAAEAAATCGHDSVAVYLRSLA
jgi:ankyrin repeat protein